MALQTTFLEERKTLINKILSSDLHGKKIYILGSAEFGPTNQPILCRSTVGVTTNFGTRGTLIEAFHKIKYVSKDNYIYLVKTTGDIATCYLNVLHEKDVSPITHKDGCIDDCETDIENSKDIQEGSTFHHNGFILTSIGSNEIYNEIKVIVDNNSLNIIYPKELGNKTFSYNYSEYPTIESLTIAINKDVENKKGYVNAYYAVPAETKTVTAFSTCNPSEVYFYGGYCGLNYTKNMLYNALQRTYDLLESMEIDIIIPIDAFLDDIFPDDLYSDETHYGQKYYQRSKDYLTRFADGRCLSYMNQLINFCLHQLNFGVVTHGIMGYNSVYKQYSDYYKDSDGAALMWKACLAYNLNCCDNPFYSFFVSIVAGDIYYNQGTYIDNGYLAYAALCAKTVLNIGTTNKPISNTISIYHEMSEDVLESLSNAGIVTFRQSPLYNTPVIYNGVTAFQNNDDLKLFCNVRMIQLTVSYINRMFQLYIGMSIQYLLKNNIINNDLEKILSLLKDMKILTNYDFNIVTNYNNYEIKVYLNLETNYMIHSITICPVINIEFQENEG